MFDRRPRRFFSGMAAFLLMVAVAGPPGSARARGVISKDPPTEADQRVFTGIIKVAPRGQQGLWLIGGRGVPTSPDTRFEESHGPLVRGVCARVLLTGGNAQVIDSEPLSSCQPSGPAPFRR